MDAMNLALVAAMAVGFLAVLAGVQSVYWAYVARKEKQARDFAKRLGMIGDEATESLFRERARDTVAESLGNIGENLRDTIISADSNLTVGALLTRMAILGLATSAIFTALFGLPGIITGIVPAFLPYWLLKQAGNKRQRLLLEQLPEALDLMARSMQAGLGLSDAFRLAAEEMPLPLAAEFGRVFEEVRLGRDYRDALTHLLERNHGVFDLRLFVSSVMLQRETGGNLIEILDNIASTIRNRFLFHAKVKALTAEAKFSAYILGGLPIGVAGLIFVVNVDYLKPLVTDPMGNLMLLYCLGSYSFGIFIMRDVSKVEV